MILPDLITGHLKSKSKQKAFVYRDKAITYGELQDQILRCTEGLKQLGVKKGNTFAIVLRNCPEFVIFTMALANLGAVSVPINFLEKPDRIKLILKDAKASGVLTAKEFLSTVTEATRGVKSVQHVFSKDQVSSPAQSFETLLRSKPWAEKSQTADEDLMTLLYTSGTTGQPKGVMLTHKNFLSNIQQCLDAIDVSEDDRFLCLLPMFHSFSWTVCVLVPLHLGTWSVIIESLLPFEPVIKAIWTHKITIFVGVPQIFGALATKIRGAKALIVRFLNPIRIAISGAAPLPSTIHLAFEKTIGSKLLEGYGLTEASPVVSLNPIKKRKIGTVGLPLPGVLVEIHDDNGKRLPQGEIGEIWILGDNVMQGYYHKPEETKEALSKDGWLKSGDLGFLDKEGYLTLVDRKKDLIIIKGLNVYPQEVENVIATVRGVKEVAVVGKPDPETGDELIRAFVVPKEGEQIDKSAVMDACRDKLAAYKRPKDIVVMTELPKNALQKILKKELRKL